MHKSGHNMAIHRIAVFRALNLGDMLCATPAFRALRQAFPRADIALIGLPWARAFQRRYRAYLDRFFSFPGYPGLPEATGTIAQREDFFEQMRGEGFDLALQLHGSGPASNEVLGRLGARTALGLGAGVQRPGLRLWPYPEDRHEVHRTLYLLQEGLGIAAHDDRLEFPLHPEDWNELRRHPELDACRKAPYACQQAGARNPAKRWPAGHFAAVGDALAERGLRIVLTGSEAERGLARDVMARMRHRAVNAACDISIGGLAALLSGARLLVTNDTGVAHLSSALQVPSIVIFFATDPARWGPPDDGRHIVVRADTQPEPLEVIRAAATLMAMSESGGWRKDTTHRHMT